MVGKLLQLGFWSRFANFFGCGRGLLARAIGHFLEQLGFSYGLDDVSLTTLYRLPLAKRSHLFELLEFFSRYLEFFVIDRAPRCRWDLTTAHGTALSRQAEISSTVHSSAEVSEAAGFSFGCVGLTGG